MAVSGEQGKATTTNKVTDTKASTCTTVERSRVGVGSEEFTKGVAVTSIVAIENGAVLLSMWNGQQRDNGTVSLYKSQGLFIFTVNSM